MLEAGNAVEGDQRCGQSLMQEQVVRRGEGFGVDEL